MEFPGISIKALHVFFRRNQIETRPTPGPFNLEPEVQWPPEKEMNRTWKPSLNLCKISIYLTNNVQ